MSQIVTDRECGWKNHAEIGTAMLGNAHSRTATSWLGLTERQLFVHPRHLRIVRFDRSSSLSKTPRTPRKHKRLHALLAA